MATADVTGWMEMRLHGGRAALIQWDWCCLGKGSVDAGGCRGGRGTLWTDWGPAQGPPDAEGEAKNTPFLGTCRVPGMVGPG